jgi:putative metallohydrolase (TIGR04338 family)
MRPRDNQRQRVYSAEEDAGHLREHESPAARRMLFDEARLLRQRNHGSHHHNGRPVAPAIEDAQRYVDDLCRQAWFQRRFGQRRIQVVWKASGKATGGTRIALPPWARHEETILHETAHVLTEHTVYGSAAWHGPEFTATLLTLVRYRMGEDAYKTLRATMRHRRVRVGAMPKPSRTVVTQAERAAKRRAVAARPVTAAEAAQAAAVLRRAATSGVFGPSGRKPRTHALETARALEALTPAPARAAAAKLDARRS